jgi:hypothetical protein
MTHNDGTHHAAVDADAYEAGLRAGYGHGYDIGLAHGRAELDIESAADIPAPRLSGPDRAELRERGYIERDLGRPPALPVRLWTTEDWAKADLRDLPATEGGRAAWRDAIDAGVVPARLADAFATEGYARDPAEPTQACETGRVTPSAEELRAAVNDAGRRITKLRARIAETQLDEINRRTAEGDRQRVADVNRWLIDHDRDQAAVDTGNLHDRAGGR